MEGFLKGSSRDHSQTKDWMAKIELKDAYFLVPVIKGHQKLFYSLSQGVQGIACFAATVIPTNVLVSVTAQKSLSWKIMLWLPVLFHCGLHDVGVGLEPLSLLLVPTETF